MKRKTTIQLSLLAPEPPEEETAEAATEPVDEAEQLEEVEAEEIGPVFSACIPAQPAAIAPATTVEFHGSGSYALLMILELP